MGTAEQAPPQQPVEKKARADAQERDVSPHPVAAGHQADASQSASSVRKPEAPPTTEQRTDAVSTASAAAASNEDHGGSEVEQRTFASQKDARHGSARPK
jgi:hypothetical protein